MLNFKGDLLLFPSVVSEFEVSEATILNDQLNNTIKTVLNVDRDENSAPQKGLVQTHDELHDLKEFIPLVGHIKDAVRHYLSSLDFIFESFVITGMWATVLKPGAMHQLHTHPNNFLSGVYYTKVGASLTGGRIFFFDPRSEARVIAPEIASQTTRNSQRWAITPREGMLLLFPSWLPHYVETNASNERSSVSFNIMLKGGLGSHSRKTFSNLG